MKEEGLRTKRERERERETEKERGAGMKNLNCKRNMKRCREKKTAIRRYMDGRAVASKGDFSLYGLSLTDTGQISVKHRGVRGANIHIKR